MIKLKYGLIGGGIFKKSGNILVYENISIMWKACSVRRWCACVYSRQHILLMQIFSKVHTNTQSQLPKVRRNLIGKIEYSPGGDKSRPQMRVTTREKFAYIPLCKVCINSLKKFNFTKSSLDGRGDASSVVTTSIKNCNICIKLIG